MPWISMTNWDYCLILDIRCKIRYWQPSYIQQDYYLFTNGKTKLNANTESLAMEGVAMELCGIIYLYLPGQHKRSADIYI